MPPKTTNLINATITHFRSFEDTDELLKNTIGVIWVSPEQEYYQNDEFLKATVDLINKTFDPATCKIYIAIAGFLQRFNYYTVNHEEVDENESTSCALKAMNLGSDWWRNKKHIFDHLLLWHKHLEGFCILTDQEYRDSKKAVDDKYGKDEKFRRAFADTTQFIFQSLVSRKKFDEKQEQIFRHNRCAYLQEESACVIALSKASKIRSTRFVANKIAIIYPRNPTPVMKEAISFANGQLDQSNGYLPIEWMTVDQRTHPYKEAVLNAFLVNSPKKGCNLNIALSKSRGKQFGENTKTAPLSGEPKAEADLTIKICAQLILEIFSVKLDNASDRQSIAKRLLFDAIVQLMKSGGYDQGTFPVGSLTSTGNNLEMQSQSSPPLTGIAGPIFHTKRAWLDGDPLARRDSVADDDREASCSNGSSNLSVLP